MRNKSLYKLISFILAILLIITFPISAFADDDNGNGTGEGGGSSTENMAGGVRYSRAAYLIYIVNVNGTLLTPVVEAAIDGCETPPSSANYDYELSKFGNQAPTRFVTISGVPTPFTSKGDGNGVALKNKLLETKNDEYEAVNVIRNYFGTSTAESFLKSNEEQYLIFEAVYWFKMSSGSLNGKWIVATSTGWANALEANGYDEYGASKFSRYTNNIFPNCMKFEFAQLGLAPCPSGKQTNATIMSSASGIISVWNNEISNNIQTTYNESKGDTPAPPADESDGTYTIVKNYRYSEDDGKTYKNAGCFNIKNIDSTILIEDEKTYKVVGYKISTTESTNVNSLTWENSVPSTITKSGTSATEVTLSNSEKCLYVLLEKIDLKDVEENPPQPYDFQLQQSQITKRVTFLTSSGPANTSSLITHNFTWTAPAPTKTSCTSHDGNGHQHNCKHTCGNSCKDGCSHSCGNSCYDTPCTSWKWTDNTTKLGITLDTSSLNKAVVSKNNSITYNQPAVNTITTSNKYYKNNTSTRSGTSQNTQSISNFNYITVLFRGQDHLTLADWKNGGAISYLTNLAYDSAYNFKSANTPQGTRKSGTEYNETFATRFINRSPDMSTTYKATVGSAGICSTTASSYRFDTDFTLNDIVVNDPVGFIFLHIFRTTDTYKIQS